MVQVKLLRVLQEKRFERVGGTETIDSDVRLVCATQKNLKEEVEAGRFREDLFYRLNVVQVALPPLRERKEDILVLAEHLLQRSTSRTSRVMKGFPQRPGTCCSIIPFRATFVNWKIRLNERWRWRRKRMKSRRGIFAARPSVLSWEGLCNPGAGFVRKECQTRRMRHNKARLPKCGNDVNGTISCPCWSGKGGAELRPRNPWVFREKPYGKNANATVSPPPTAMTATSHPFKRVWTAVSRPTRLPLSIISPCGPRRRWRDTGRPGKRQYP